MRMNVFCIVGQQKFASLLLDSTSPTNTSRISIRLHSLMPSHSNVTFQRSVSRHIAHFTHTLQCYVTLTYINIVSRLHSRRVGCDHGLNIKSKCRLSTDLPIKTLTTKSLVSVPLLPPPTSNSLVGRARTKIAIHHIGDPDVPRTTTASRIPVTTLVTRTLRAPSTTPESLHW